MSAFTDPTALEGPCSHVNGPRLVLTPYSLYHHDTENSERGYLQRVGEGARNRAHQAANPRIMSVRRLIAKGRAGSCSYAHCTEIPRLHLLRQDQNPAILP